MPSGEEVFGWGCLTASVGAAARVKASQDAHCTGRVRELSSVSLLAVRARYPADYARTWNLASPSGDVARMPLNILVLHHPPRPDRPRLLWRRLEVAVAFEVAADEILVLSAKTRETQERRATVSSTTERGRALDDRLGQSSASR